MLMSMRRELWATAANSQSTHLCTCFRSEAVSFELSRQRLDCWRLSSLMSSAGKSLLRPVCPWYLARGLMVAPSLFLRLSLRHRFADGINGSIRQLRVASLGLFL